jgi:hypothetical protein
MEISHIAFAGFLALVFVSMGYQAWRHGGLRGAMYGGRFVRAIDTIPGDSFSHVKTEILVNVLEKSGQGKVGLGVKQKSYGGFHVSTARLNPDQAQALARALKEAAEAARHVGQGPLA